MTIEEKIEKTYYRRKNRLDHPKGKFDSAGRWYPAEEEERDCCAHIRRPSRAYPYSLLVHCRTKKHIRQLYS